MSLYFELHRVNPEQRLIRRAAEVIRTGGVIAYPTDSCYALGCHIGDKDALERVRRIRQADRHHHFTLMCRDLTEIGRFARIDTWQFRLLKAGTPGPYTFVLPATREAPKVMLNDRKKTVGVRLPQHTTALALLSLLGEPLMSSTLILPGEDEPLADGWTIADTLGHEVDAVLDSGDVGLRPTTVIDLSGEEPAVVRLGAGDPEPFL